MRSLRLVMILTVVAPVVAQIPPMFEMVTIDPDPTFNYIARMNNHGQIVYSLWTIPGEVDGIEIMLYDNGVITQLTNDNVYDRTPDINDDGTIVWARAVNGPGSPTEIVIYRKGVLTQLTDNMYDDRGPRINNLGHVAWKRIVGVGCRGNRVDIFSYDGSSIQRITTDGEANNLANQSVSINDRDEIVWSKDDFCVTPWTSRIMRHSSGVTTQLSAPNLREPRAPQINNLGQVAWTFSSTTGLKGIQLWDSGITTTLTDWGSAAALNDRGDIALYRFYAEGPAGAYEAWLYRNGQFLQITDEPHNRGWFNNWNLPSDMNARGEFVFTSGRPWHDVGTIESMRLRLRSVPPGTIESPDEVRRILP